MIYGSIPAAGQGSRLQPLAFSKELALAGDKTVIEHLLERMTLAGISRIFVTISPDKLDIPRYLSTKSPYKDNLTFVIKDSKSLPESIFASKDFIKKTDHLVFGLPDTIWFPMDSYSKLIKEQKGDITLGLFDSGTPEKFDSVVTDDTDRITAVDVKVPDPKTKWTWGIGMIKKQVISKIENLLEKQGESEAILGKAIDMYCKKNTCYAVKFAGSSYLDIGRKEDYARIPAFLKNHE